MKYRGSVFAVIALALFATGAQLASAQESIIYSFVYGGSDGLSPYSGLISDSAGNLYGTTSSGGAVGAPFGTDGAVFELTPGTGGTWTEKILYSFGATTNDGAVPFAGLVLDAKGNLYGTTSGGGANGDGTVFELSPATGGTWTEKILYSFGATATDASGPKRGSLIFDAAGNLYGTTRFGGAHQVSNGGGSGSAGTVFELTPGSGGSWTEKVLYSFGATTSDGANPLGGLIFDAAGNLYGTTLYGGTDASVAGGSGTVFELSPATGGTWKEKILHSFKNNGTDGANPSAGLVFDAKGNLYGTTTSGGGGSDGTAFELSLNLGSGVWTEKILHNFTGEPDGSAPYGGLILDGAGDLYGMTSAGGGNSVGSVFQLKAGSGTENVLYSFINAASDGQSPQASAFFDPAGNLYGTTSAGGTNSFGFDGTVFEIASVINGTPVFSVPSGAYSAAQTVTITDPTAAATIYFSINGGAATKYTVPIAVSGSEVIQAYALGSLPESQLATASYQVGSVAATPYFSPGAGTYAMPLAVTLTDAAPGATIYYTTNGTTPTTSSPKYSGPITVSAAETIEALAVAAGFTNSPVASAKYTAAIAATPQFSPGAGTYTLPQPVTLTDATSGATIYYTTNGTTPTTSSTKYTSPINVAAPETIEAIAVATGDNNSPVASATYTGAGIAPQISPATGTYTLPQPVTLTDAVSGATIYYTTDGTNPTTSSTKYTGPINVSVPETIEAIAVATGYTNSTVASATYTGVGMAPQFSPPAGTYTLPQPVTLTDAVSSATIHYTTNGTTPTTSSPVYSKPITVSATETIEALAVATGYTNSSVASATYTQASVATPQFSPPAGAYTFPQSVTLTDANSSATIHYTTNGTTPTTSSPVYSKPITVSVPETIKALAVVTGDKNSSVASATYTGIGTAPQFSPPGGTYASTQSVTLTAAAGATIYYTTNGTTPTTSSPVYTSPIAVSAIETIEAFAVATGYSNSPVASATYIVTKGETVPTIIYNFKGSPDDVSNSLPGSTLAQGRDGNIYGSMQSGGSYPDGGFFMVEPSGTERLLDSFNSSTDGILCGQGVILGTDGNFYGDCGDNNSAGSIYKVTPSGTLSILTSIDSPAGPPVQATDGNFYGTFGGYTGSIYKLTPGGTMTTIAASTDGNFASGLLQGVDGNLYGTNQYGGTDNCGTIYKTTLSGQVSLLHNFSCTDGEATTSMIQGTDGNFYGATYLGGANNQGVVFKMTPSGTLTVLHNFSSATDGASPQGGFLQASDGNFYGIAFGGGFPGGFDSGGLGSIFKITPAGVFTTLYLFDGTTVGANPVALIQNTNGLLYGYIYSSATSSLGGAFFSLNVGAKPFVNLVSTSGKVGSKIGILGQGFSASSVVKFNGVAATTVTLSGTTFLLATVPAGASDGSVAVTTGATTLTSSKKFVVHNSWGSGTAMPTAAYASATGVLGGKIYVVGGATKTAILNNNQILNPTTNTWSSGAVLPTTIRGAVGAVVSNVLYVIGGSTDGTTITNAVWAYSPTTNSWTSKSAMLTARQDAGVVVDGNIIYVIGGVDAGTTRLATVESYNPATNTWKEEAPLLAGKSEPSVGLLGTTIVAAGGYTSSGDTGDNEGYTVSTNTWKALTSDPTTRNASCSGSLLSQLYVAGGYTGTNPALTATESFSATTNKWTTQASMPQAAMEPGSAVSGSLLYCIGGEDGFQGNVLNNVQIYQP